MICISEESYEEVEVGGLRELLKETLGDEVQQCVFTGVDGVRRKFVILAERHDIPLIILCQPTSTSEFFWPASFCIHDSDEMFEYSKVVTSFIDSISPN